MRIEKFMSLIQENNSPEIKESAVVPENIHEIKALAKLGAKAIGGIGGRLASSGTARKAGGFLSRNRPAKGMGSGIARGISKFAGSGRGKGAMSAAGIEPQGGFFKTLGSEIKKNYGMGGKSLQKSVAGRYAGSEQNKDVDAAMRKQGVDSGDRARRKIQVAKGRFKQAVGSQIDTTKQNLEKRRADQAAAKTARVQAKAERMLANTPEGQKFYRNQEMRARVLANIEKSREARQSKGTRQDQADISAAKDIVNRRLTPGGVRTIRNIANFRARRGELAYRRLRQDNPEINKIIRKYSSEISKEAGRTGREQRAGDAAVDRAIAQDRVRKRGTDIGNTGRDVSNKGRYVGNQPRQT